MKSLLRLGLLALALLAAPFALSSGASATCGGGGGGTCFVVSGGGNSNSTSTWSASSNGASCTCVPASTDAVILDDKAGPLTINAGLTIASFDSRGTSPGSGNAYTGTITHTGGVWTITGNLFNMPATTGYAPASARVLTFTSTSGTTNITSGGHTLPSVIFNGAGGTFELLDNFSSNGTGVYGIQLSAGTLDATTNNPTVTTNTFSGGASATLNCGTNTWTFNGASGTIFGESTTTLSCTSATFSFANPSPTSWREVSIGTNQSIGTVSVSGASSGTAWPVYFLYTTGATFTALNATGPVGVILPNNTTLTLNNAPTWTGSPTGTLYLMTSNPASANPATVQIPASSAANFTYTALQYIKFTAASGSATANATNSWDLGLNSWASGASGSITAPTYGGGHIIGG